MPFLCQVLCICVISKKHGLVKRGKEEGAEPEEDTQEHHQEIQEPPTANGGVLSCTAPQFICSESF